MYIALKSAIPASLVEAFLNPFGFISQIYRVNTLYGYSKIQNGSLRFFEPQLATALGFLLLLVATFFLATAVASGYFYFNCSCCSFFLIVKGKRQHWISIFKFSIRSFVGFCFGGNSGSWVILSSPFGYTEQDGLCACDWSTYLS